MAEEHEDYATEEEEREDYSTEEEEREEEEVKSEKKKEKKKEKKEKKKKKKQKIDVKVEVIGEHPDKLGPMVGYFPSGLSSDKLKGSEVKVYKAPGSKFDLVVRPPKSKIDFVGTNYSGEARVPQHCNYGLGILDKETQTLKIVPIAGNRVFRLEPYFGGSRARKEEPPEAEEEIDVEPSNKGMYSTKKDQRRAMKNEKMRPKLDASASEHLGERMKNVVINEDAVESAAPTINHSVPPHDLTADTPEKAYPLDSIILQQEWYHLGDVMKCVQSEQELSSETYVRFVCNRAHKLLKIQDTSEKETLAGILSCINHLIKFKDQRDIDTRAAVKSHRIPDILFRKFMALFTDPESSKIEPPPEKKDLLINYILALALHADGFQSEVSDIVLDLRMTNQDLRTYYESLGCKLKNVDKKLVATLPVPLNFPKLLGKRGRARR